MRNVGVALDFGEVGAPFQNAFAKALTFMERRGPALDVGEVLEGVTAPNQNMMQRDPRDVGERELLP